MAKLNSTNDFHYIKYGIAKDRKYLETFINSFANLIINATTLADTPKALFTLLNSKIFDKINYIIDPQTHAFQHNRSFIISSSQKNKGKNIIKRSINKLVSAYGNPISKAIQEKRILSINDFNNINIKYFCNNVINFQINTIKDQETESDVSDYYKFLKSKKIITFNNLTPKTVIAPYFYLDDPDYIDWLRLNIRCIENSKTSIQKSNKVLSAELVLSKYLLNDKNKIDNIIEAYNSINIDKLFLWVDSFSEHDADETTLNSYIYFLNNIKHPIINLHGGYFSILLKKLGICENLSGVTHGIGFGEDRSVIPVGGGVPTAKFYLPVLHKRLIFRNALKSVEVLWDKNYFSDICDCPMCREIIKGKKIEEFEIYGKTNPGRDGKEYPTKETIHYCIMHYMYNKDYEFSNDINFQDISYELKRVYSMLKGHLGSDDIAHCKKWINILEKKYKN